MAVPIPYHHSNLQSRGDDLLRLRATSARARAIEVGSITLHPSGLPHGPQPGLAEKSLGVDGDAPSSRSCATRSSPLKLSTFARDLDDGTYAYSWYEPPSDEPSLAGVTSHL